MSSFLKIIMAVSLAVALSACDREEEICERCEYRFDWNSEGVLTNTIKNCAEIGCNSSQCGICHDMVFNGTGLLVEVFCDSCYTCRDAEGNELSDQRPCQDVVSNQPRCVDLYTDNYHCGACGEACEGGTTCIDGTCR